MSRLTIAALNSIEAHRITLLLAKWFGQRETVRMSLRVSATVVRWRGRDYLLALHKENLQWKSPTTAA